MARLFVYGTLKRGFSNARMLRGATFERAAATAPGFALYSVDAYPALVGTGTNVVRGELYTLSEEHLARLDVFEDVPTSYQRRTIALDDGTRAEAYVMSAEAVTGRARIRGDEYVE